MQLPKPSASALLLASLLCSSPQATAQSLYNFKLGSQVTACVVDWHGKPALCIIAPPRPGAAAFGFTYPWPATPKVTLDIQALYVTDSRPCAATAWFALAPQGEGLASYGYKLVGGTFYQEFAPLSLPQAGWRIGPEQMWNVDYCNPEGPCYDNCGPAGPHQPECYALIATLRIQ